MARGNVNTTDTDSGLGISRSTLISGIIAVVVIVGLFVLFNALPGSKPAQPAEEQKEEQQAGDEEKKDQAESKKENGSSAGETVELPANYTVVKGDSLWKISIRFYGTGYGWTKIAAENKLSNPNVILAGQKLTIPKASIKPISHKVAKGDTLWNIAQKYYGSGFEWTKIQNANAGKIGKLPNGNSLITPGQVLTIP